MRAARVPGRVPLAGGVLPTAAGPTGPRRRSEQETMTTRRPARTYARARATVRLSNPCYQAVAYFARIHIQRLGSAEGMVRVREGNAWRLTKVDGIY